jgi:uncharacterized protein (DUF2147 family)
MKKLMVLMAIAVAAFAISASLPVESAGTTIVGTWKTIDDETGKARSHVKIYKAKDGKYYGKIEKLLNRTKEEGDDPYCKVCPKDDYRYNKRVIGMSIVSRMKGSSDLKSASGGKILDPKSGKSYKCSMSVADGGKKLNVRGYMGISALGRTQTWIRIK